MTIPLTEIRYRVQAADLHAVERTLLRDGRETNAFANVLVEREDGTACIARIFLTQEQTAEQVEIMLRAHHLDFQNIL